MLIVRLQGYVVRGCWLLGSLLGFLLASDCHATLSESLTIGNAKALALGNAVTIRPVSTPFISILPVWPGSMGGSRN